MEQQLDTSSILELLGELNEWCKQHNLYLALKCHNNPHDPYCMPLYAAFVMEQDIKLKYQVIHVNFANVWFLLNAASTIETG